MTFSHVRRVTLMDAEAAFRAKATQILEAAGAAVSLAEKPETLLESGAEHPDLLIASIDRMTEKPERFLERLRKAAPGMRVLVVTGFMRLEEAVRLLDAGADDLALKPIIWGHFRHVVTRLLAPPVPDAPPAAEPPAPPPEPAPVILRLAPPEVPAPASPAPALPVAPSGGVSPAEYATVLHPFATSMRLILDGHLGEVPGEVRSVVELLHGGLDWLDQIAREDLAVSLGSEPAPAPGPVSVYPLLEWVAEVFNPVAYVRSVEVATEPPPAPVETVIDPHDLTLILFCLVSQAVHESRPGDEVRMSVKSTSERVVIEVTDTALTAGDAHTAIADDALPSPEDRTPDAALTAARRRAAKLGATLERTRDARRRTVFRLSLPVTSVTPGGDAA